MLLELSRREKNAGIKPDEDLDIFMKVYTFLVKNIDAQALFTHFRIIFLSLGISFAGREDEPCGRVHLEGNELDEVSTSMLALAIVVY